MSPGSSDRPVISFVDQTSRRVVPNPAFSKAPVRARSVKSSSCRVSEVVASIPEDRAGIGTSPAAREEQKHPPKALNKKQLITLRLQGHSCHGHRWVQGSSCANNNITMKCSVCGLYVQQTHKPEVISRLLQQPCKDLGDIFEDWNIHTTHTMQNLGRVWACRRCGKQQYPGKSDRAPGLVKECVGAPRKKTLVGQLVTDRDQRAISSAGSRPAALYKTTFGVKPENRVPKKPRQTKLAVPSQLNVRGPASPSAKGLVQSKLSFGKKDDPTP